MLRKFIVFVFIISTCILKGNNLYYGLTFLSHTVNQDLRTSLLLTDEEKLSFPYGFSLEFDLRMQVEELAYGYIFRIITGDEQSLDLVSNVNTGNLNFVLAGIGSAFSNVEFTLGKEERLDWIKVKLKVNKENIECTINNVSKEIPHSLNNLHDVQIFFGKNKHPVFYTSDVPPVTIRDVIMRNPKEEIIRNWPMNRHNRNEVYDDVKNNVALVENGVWEMDKHVRWEKQFSLSLMEKNAQIAYDSSQARVFIAITDSVFIYHIKEKELEKNRVISGRPFRSGGSHMVYDNKKHRLISYSLVYTDFNTYDFEKREWTSEEIEEGLPPIQHHNRYVHQSSNQLILFGGYGNHTYNAELIKHNLDSGRWERVNLASCIPPRYLSAMGYAGDDKLYILGGFGSTSGRQEESPKNLYDVYELDFTDYSCRQLTSFSTPKEPIVFGNSMVIEKNENKIYTLAYNNDRFHSPLYLLSLDLTSSETEILGDSIPYNFLDTESFCDLFLDKESSMLYAVVLQRKEEAEIYDLEIYSLAYPPLKISDVMQTPPGKSSNKTWIGVGIFALLFLSFIYFFFKRKRHSKVTWIDTKETDTRKEKKIDVSSIELKKQHSTIRLLGGFQVFDRNGNDITERFTPILKHIFLFILLNSIKEGKKITSDKLDETFWEGMDKASAANNRSVNIRKIRVLLEKVNEDIVLSNKNSYWSLSLGKDVFCDYYEAMILFKKIQEDRAINREALEMIMELASGGILLPNVNLEWADAFKTEYNEFLSDVLTKAVRIPEFNKDLKLLLRIANLLLLYDNLDEDAVRLKCRVLFDLGQKGVSKQCFDKYVQDHVKLLNAKPNFTYKEMFGK
ncbi:MAG: DUF1040 family protein [Candidatus Azobacteroides sp.]|nr:DUF1040 family protein [Candidatus Azobacteroides sp.]